jgi:ABC-2 type transport system ATP-binding protein
VIYTSHYMEEIEAVADHVAILDGGQILRNDSLSRLLQSGSIQVRFTVKGAMDPSVLTALSEMGEVTEQAELVELRLHAGTPLSRLFLLLERSGVDVGDVHVGRATLEHVFLALTDRRLRDE